MYKLCTSCKLEGAKICDEEKKKKMKKENLDLDCSLIENWKKFVNWRTKSIKMFHIIRYASGVTYVVCIIEFGECCRLVLYR